MGFASATLNFGPLHSMAIIQGVYYAGLTDWFIKTRPTATVQAAIGALQQELIYFFEAYEKKPQLVIRNPFFGDLNFEENVQLLFKHALHHLKQFGVEPTNF